MHEEEQGLGANYQEAELDPLAEWWRAARRGDRRLTPSLGSGRRMRHPYHPPIVYPRTPDQTYNFGYDRMRRAPSVVTKTAGGSAVAKYPEFGDDVILREVWVADALSTHTALLHQFRRYWLDLLPDGRFIGWQPRDLTWKRYFVEILDVSAGPADEYLVEELGTKRPWLMRQALAVTFKLVREFSSPSGVMIAEGA